MAHGHAEGSDVSGGAPTPLGLHWTCVHGVRGSAPPHRFCRMHSPVQPSITPSIIAWRSLKSRMASYGNITTPSVATTKLYENVNELMLMR